MTRPIIYGVKKKIGLCESKHLFRVPGNSKFQIVTVFISASIRLFYKKGTLNAFKKKLCSNKSESIAQFGKE